MEVQTPPQTLHWDKLYKCIKFFKIHRVNKIQVNLCLTQQWRLLKPSLWVLWRPRLKQRHVIWLWFAEHGECHTVTQRIGHFPLLWAAAGHCEAICPSLGGEHTVGKVHLIYSALLLSCGSYNRVLLGPSVVVSKPEEPSAQRTRANGRWTLIIPPPTIHIPHVE
jgi:hypothetical protein